MPIHASVSGSMKDLLKIKAEHRKEKKNMLSIARILGLTNAFITVRGPIK